MATKRASSISILVVDDHRTFAEALALAVRLERDMEAWVAANGADAVEIVRRERPHVVLLDMEMPGMGGVETIRRLLEVEPETKIVVLSAHDDDLVKARAVEAGAIGYVSKITPLTDLPDLVRRAHRGEPILDTQERSRLLRHLRHRRHQEATERQRVNRLTPRQTEILQMLAEGVPPSEIAGRLGMSPLTLRTHVQNILTRLGVHTKLEAMALAIRHGKVKAVS
ncbi:MAG TPA: response regulator transcription factor [Actinomycetota bacterium]|nr:response regulator transcription factor [Actinomycetota bacterium]